jgi:hypothetical protein
MYFSSLPIVRTDALLEDVGFEIEFADTVTEDEEGQGQATFHWVVSQKPEREGANRR